MIKNNTYVGFFRTGYSVLTPVYCWFDVPELCWEIDTTRLGLHLILGVPQQQAHEVTAVQLTYKKP